MCKVCPPSHSQVTPPGWTCVAVPVTGQQNMQVSFQAHTFINRPQPDEDEVRKTLWMFWEVEEITPPDSSWTTLE